MCVRKLFKENNVVKPLPPLRVIGTRDQNEPQPTLRASLCGWFHSTSEELCMMIKVIIQSRSAASLLKSSVSCPGRHSIMLIIIISIHISQRHRDQKYPQSIPGGDWPG